jgi:putative ABC transport system permease protein
MFLVALQFYSKTLHMLRNYLRVALRSLLRNRFFAAINIGGLAVGMAVALLIGLWIQDELSFDKYHEQYDRIVQVLQKEKFLGKTKVWEHQPFLLLDALRTGYGAPFEHIVASVPADGFLLSVNAPIGPPGVAGGADQKKMPAKGLYMDADGPDMLTLKMLKGSRSGLAGDLHSILLSASVARALFGDGDPIGKRVTMDNQWDPGNQTPVVVKGVYEDLPRNTSFHDAYFLLPWSLYTSGKTYMQQQQGWDDHRINIYAELKPGVNRDRLSAAIADFELSKIRGLAGTAQEVAAGPQLLLHPMSRWHLYSNFKEGVAEQGPVQFVWMMGIIGGFVLLLACINFMNLSTARSEKRAKEVGVRKAIGSLRGQLTKQFYVESFVVVVLAFLPAVGLATLALPWFDQLSAKQLEMPWGQVWFWMFAAVFILITGLLSGSYPALYLSSFNPVAVLKGRFRAGRYSALPRKALVVLQFTVSVALIIATIVVYNQILFAKDRPVGYTREGLLMVPITSLAFDGKYDLLRDQLKKTGVVAEVAESESAVTDVSSHNGGFDWPGKPVGLQEDFGTLTVTYDYGKTVGWQFLAGRDFSPAYGSDSSGFVINESAAKFMGLKQPVGQSIHWKVKWANVDTSFTIIGVIRDMVMQSPYEPVKPTVFRLGGNYNWIYVRIDPRVSAATALNRIGPVFHEVIPQVPFEYRFADDEYEKKFAAEQRVGNVAGVFSVLAIVISCLGLFGMAMYVAEQRTREIGVRKVLGASVLNLWGLLSREFVWLVGLSLVTGGPISFWVMHSWLQNYSYHTGLSWWIFALTAIGAIGITLLTVSYQAIKTALANPVVSLRSE